MFQPTEATTAPLQAASDSAPFLHSPSNGPFYRGETRYFPSNVAVTVVTMGVTLIVMLAMMGILSRSMAETGALRQRGQPVQATIIGERISTGSIKTGNTYYMTYQYRVADRDYTQEVVVSSKAYNTIAQGTPVRVLYLPDNPAISMIDGKAPNSDLSGLFFAFVAVVFVIVLIFLVVFIRGWLRNRKMARDGHIIPGVLLDATGRMVAGKHPYFELRLNYHFKTPAGRDIRATSGAPRDDLRKSSLPASGTPLAVLYLDDKRYKLL